MNARRVLLRLVLPAVAAVLVVAVAAPFLSANRFRGRIQRALERSLHRHVTLGSLHFTLLRGPGFDVEDVLIADDAAAGVEPFIYVSSMQASVSLISIFSQHLAFSTLRLDEPTVNLVKTSEGVWNVQAFLSGTPALAGKGIPDIEIRSGRLNFKFGDTKSVFYVSNADVDIYRASGGALGIRFAGEPARTDRGAQGFARITGRGLLASPGSDPHLNLGLVLERSNLSDIFTLVEGHDVGIHGFASGNVHLGGPLTRVGISGELTLTDLHRWDLITQRTGDGWPIDFQGVWDAPGQSLRLDTIAPPGQTVPVEVHLSVDSYLAAPKWQLGANLHDVPAEPVVETARHFGAPIPTDIQISGKVNGSLAYAGPDHLEGELSLAEGVITSPAASGKAAASAKLEDAALTLKDGEAEFGPAILRLDEDESVTFRASYGIVPQKLTVRLDTEKLGVERIKTGAGRLLGAISIPVLESCKDGSWRGWAEYSWISGAPEVWSGRFDVLNSQIAFPDLAAPVHLASATIAIDASKLQISHFRASAGKLTFDGDLRYDAESKKPAHLRLHSAAIDLAELERLFMPALRRQDGLLARFQLGRPPIPEWLQARKIEGSLDAGAVSYGTTPLGSITSRYLWEAASLQFTKLEWKQDESAGSGRLDVNLSGAAPSFKLSGNVRRPDWRGGELKIEGALTASGVGQALLASARSDGTFQASNVELTPDMDFDEISGSFHSALVGDAYQLELLNVRASKDDETYTGQGSSQPDGRILIEIASGKRQIRELMAGLRTAPAVAPHRQ